MDNGRSLKDRDNAFLAELNRISGDDWINESKSENKDENKNENKKPKKPEIPEILYIRRNQSDDDLDDDAEPEPLCRSHWVARNAEGEPLFVFINEGPNRGRFFGFAERHIEGLKDGTYTMDGIVHRLLTENFSGART